MRRPGERLLHVLGQLFGRRGDVVEQRFLLRRRRWVRDRRDLDPFHRMLDARPSVPARGGKRDRGNAMLAASPQ